MATKAQKVQLGIFLVVTVILMVGTLIALTGSQFWESRSEYFVHFQESVSGLELGAPVKYRGVRVGTVNSIRVSTENLELVEVRFSVDALTPITADTEALITTQGITGLKYIELMGGTEGSKLLPPGSFVRPGQGIFDQLTGRASDMSVKAELLLNNLLHITRPENLERFDSMLVQGDEFMGRLNSLTEEVTKTTELARLILEENQQPLRGALVGVEKTSEQAHLLLAQANQTIASLEGVMGDMRLPQTIAQFRDTNHLVQAKLQEVDVTEAMDNMTMALNTLRTLLESLTQTMHQNQDQLRATLHNLRRASDSLKEFGRSVQEQPSRLLFDDQPKQRK